MRVLVTGGRDFNDSALLFDTLDQLDITVLAQGGARGADTIARAWAGLRGIPVQTYPADWRKFQRAAGPRRNLFMLADFQPDLIVAFPGGHGTAHCVKAARNLGIKVLDVGGRGKHDR